MLKAVIKEGIAAEIETVLNGAISSAHFVGTDTGTASGNLLNLNEINIIGPLGGSQFSTSSAFLDPP